LVLTGIPPRTAGVSAEAAQPASSEELIFTASTDPRPVNELFLINFLLEYKFSVMSLLINFL
jgi:hypothetical protein